MIPDLSLYDAADRKHANPAERCDGCGAPDGATVSRGAIRGVPAWAAWPTWWWTSIDGRALGIHIPDLMLGGVVAVRSDRLQAETVALKRGRCATCRKSLPAAPLLEFLASAPTHEMPAEQENAA